MIGNINDKLIKRKIHNKIGLQNSGLIVSWRKQIRTLSENGVIKTNRTLTV